MNKVNIDDTNLSDEYYVVKKISFWTNLFYKIKNNKQPKLLSSVELKPQKTFKSIFYMWNLGNFRTLLFNSLDFFNNIFFHFLEKNSINSIQTQIIGKDINNTIAINNSKISIIVPKPINISKNINK